MKEWLLRLLTRRPGRSRLDMSPFAPHPKAGVLVGGAVRDALLGVESRDHDWLVTDAREAAVDLAGRLDGHPFELDGTRGHWRVVSDRRIVDLIPRHASLDDDLTNRDYTINALAATAQGNIIDVTGGLDDLRRRRLRMIAERNLRADPLRIFRGVRFAVTLGFVMDTATEAAVRECAGDLADGSLAMPAPERLRDELDALIESSRPGDAFSRLEGLGLLAAVLPELAACRGVEQGGLHHLDVLDHSLEAVQRLATGFPHSDLALRWATLLHDVGKPVTRERGEDGRLRFHGHDKLGAELARSLLLRLRKSRREAERAAALVRYHMLPLPKDDREARRFAHRRRDLLPDLLMLMIADREAARGPLSSEGSRRAYRTALSRILSILAEAPPIPPLLDGHEVMRLLGLEPGPRVGEAVEFLREAQAVGDVRDREEATAAVLRFAERDGWRP